MRMTIERLRMENFKGCKSLDIEFSNGRTEIAGANGTGKTTIVDAFCWVLWNTSAAGDAPGSDNFREKPLDENGEIIHNLDTTVELFCTLDGQRFDLKRTLSENWVKKRGNQEATLQGNISTYWINGVETKLTDFKQRIKAIADDEVFRLIGTLSAFNALEWRKRRAQLLALADDDVDSKLLNTDEFRQLADEVAQRNVSPDDLRKVLADRRKAINGELKLLPVRIDEATKSMPQFTSTEVKDAEYIVADTRKDIESIDTLILAEKAHSGDGDTRRRLLTLEQEVISTKRHMMDEFDAKKRTLSAAADACSDEFRRATAALDDAKRIRDRVERERDSAIASRDALRTKYTEVKRKPIEVESTCPTCGQALPASAMDEAKAKLEKAKADELAAIRSDGKKVAQDVETMEGRLRDCDSEITVLTQKLKAANEARDAAMRAVKDYPKEPDMSQNERLHQLQAEIDALNGETSTSSDEKVAALIERKRELNDLIERKLAVLARRDTAVETEKRIKMYEAQQRELGAQLSETELLIELTERFVQERCSLLEESINSHFPTVRWKLFDTQLNGGITDVCTCMIDCDGTLVPYNSANTASRIRADMEVVDVLSEHYGVRVPLFLDNAERIIDIPEIDCQTITLAVSTDSQLTIKKEA